MNDPRLDLENIRVCVILPICEFAAGGRTNSKSRLSSGGNSAASHNSLVNYDSNIESTCFSKPLISFTINSFERIHWIRRILVCSTLNRQEQVQELLQEYAATTNSGNESNKDRLKYICAQSISLTNGNSLINGNIYNNNNTHAYYHHHHNHAHHPENTFNRLLKFGLQSLRREEPYDIVIVHDVNLPYVEEPLIYDLTIEALKHGAASLCTSEVINNNFLFRFDQSNVENPENSPNFMKKGFLRSVSINSATISDFLNTSNYQIGFKPQSFQYSIFEAIFENCSNDELENDVDCVVLAKKYADITTKLIFDKNTISNYSKRICCISHYLKENHKQALILSHKSNEDAQYLQSMLRANNWNTEICSSFDKDAYFKINELLSCRNVTDGIALIKMCESMEDLSEFNIEFTLEAATKIEEELVDEETDSQSTNMLDERRSPAQASIGSSSGGGGVSENKDTVSFRRRVHQILHHVLFVVKLDAVNSSGMLSPHDTVRCALRNNATVNSDIWSASVIYEAMNPKAADLINYILSERNECMKNQILEAF